MLKFGSNGEGNGQFNAPTGVAVDSNGNIIVADWGNSRIQVVRMADTADSWLANQLLGAPDTKWKARQKGTSLA